MAAQPDDIKKIMHAFRLPEADEINLIQALGAAMCPMGTHKLGPIHYRYGHGAAVCIVCGVEMYVWPSHIQHTTKNYFIYNVGEVN